MKNKKRVMNTMLILALLALLGYVIFREVVPRHPSHLPPPPKRKGRKTIRIAERLPSAGLIWSKVQYPEQYKAENIKATELAGIADLDNERFLDVGGRAYSRVFLEDFSYTDPSMRQPRVTVEYLAKAETLVGTVKARGLKPNFAYQIKLRGRYSDDPEGFERIGYVGRWRLPGRGTNYTDAQYEACERKEDVEAYLFFDFFVTDGEGNAEKEFYGDSSLHVLWNASAQRGPQLWDGAQRVVIREGSRTDYYAHPRPNLDVQRVYAESEQHSRSRDSRNPIGQAFLPPGKYKADVVLTEESFHGYGDAGFWATVMSGPVEFEVLAQWRPPVSYGMRKLVGRTLSLSRAQVENVDVRRCDEDAIQDVALTSDPQICLLGAVEFAAGKRYALALEVAARGSHTWELFLDPGSGFEYRPTLSLATRGSAGWQRFEVELTSLIAGRRVRFRIDPSRREGPIGIRNVGVYEIEALLPGYPRPPQGHD